ncbi:MAG: prohibitin family protein [Dehalococcoidia bacterium]
MVWIALVFISTVALVGALVLMPNIKVEEQGMGPKGQRVVETLGNRGRIIPIAIYVVGLFASLLLFSVHIIDAREVGVVRTFGSITGQVGEGFQLTWPWQNVETWNTRLQVIEPDTRCSNGTDKCMDGGSIDVQDVYLSGTLNISVNPRDVQQLARNIGPNYRDTIVLNRLYQVVKETTALYKAEDIIGNRERIRQTVRQRMQEELAEYSISVDDFLLTNVDFTDAFKKSIEDKVVATQNALTEQNKVAIAEAQARQRAATAQGEADRLRIEAIGQADANREINASLTPLLIQFQALQKLGDNVQIALLPSGQGLIIDPATLLRPIP